VNSEEMGVSFEAWLKRDPKQKLGPDGRGRSQSEDYCTKMWWERSFYPSLDMILNDLHDKGLIDAGEYTIIIDW